ncbi:MAG TPA: hypothetical protein VII30_03565, partial [Gemmatimonadaceae bacterium]
MNRSSEWLLLAVVSNEILLNGFSAVRLRDLAKIDKPAPYGRFVESALRSRKQKLSRAPSIDLRDTASLLTTASAAFPLLTIHREIAEPDIAHVGTIRSASPDQIVLKEIDPNAKWERTLGRYATDEITRID